MTAPNATLAERRTGCHGAESSGKTVVFANGCFDLPHVGHIGICKVRGNSAMSWSSVSIVMSLCVA
jgi:bifunctional ADP-heptose synthase (sugar kinase/adenylyltransferase)